MNDLNTNEDSSDEVESSDGPADAAAAIPSDNPLDEFGVVLSMPRTIQVEMVDARNLGDYDLWFAITSVMLSTAVGFLTAWAQTPTDDGRYKLLLLVGLIFALMTLASGGMTFLKRRRLSKDRQQVTFKAGRTS